MPKKIIFNTTRNIRIKNRKEIKFVIAVLSSPCNYKKRYSFRNNYRISCFKKNSKLIFFTGISKLEDITITKKELTLFDDIVQFSFQNSYFNLTLLSVMAMQYSYVNFKNILFYIKTDDDMLINYKLIKEIVNNTNPSNSIIYGHLQNKKKVNRNRINKNYIPYLQYPFEYMPKYVYGALIIITKNSLIRLYNQTLYNQYYVWREDINLGILSNVSKCRIKQFPDKIDIQLKSNAGCKIHSNIIAIEFKSAVDNFYCFRRN